MRNFKEIRAHDYLIYKENEDTFITAINELFREDDPKDEKVARLAKVITMFIGKYHDYAFIGTKSGIFIKYWGGVWVEDCINSLIEVIQWYYQSATIFPTKTHITLVTYMLQNSFVEHREDFEADFDIICFHNGVYNLTDRELHPFDPKYKTFIQIPWDYNDKASCPKFMKFLMGSFDDESDIQTVWEMIGYLLTKKISMQKAFILSSPKGGTAKSTLIDIIISLIGTTNCSKVSLDQISDNRFAKSAMAHKLLNYFTDLPEDSKNMVENKGIIKDTITDKEFVYEPKGLSIQKHPNIIKLLFSCNGLPYVYNLDHAFARRWVIIDMIKKIENPIENWAEKEIISNIDEMEGILRYAIESLHTLFDRGGFNNASAEDVIDRWKAETDVVFRFVHECCIDIPPNSTEECITQQEMYQYFLCYVEQIEKNVKMQQNKFTMELKALGYSIGQVFRQLPGDTKEKHYKVYLGLKINEESPIAEFKDYIKEKIRESKETHRSHKRKSNDDTINDFL